MLRRFLMPLVAAASIALMPTLPALAYTSHRHHAAEATTATTAGSLHEYETESAAQAHCPNDVVVWLNTRTGIWHEKGMRWYGNTREGAYVCRKEAAAAGDRDTMNGQ